MTTKEFKEAANIALNQLDVELAKEDTSQFMGFGLADFKPIFCTIRQLAAIIRWQCLFINGSGHDAEALQEIAVLGKRRFQVIC